MQNSTNPPTYAIRSEASVCVRLAWSRDEGFVPFRTNNKLTNPAIYKVSAVSYSFSSMEADVDDLARRSRLLIATAKHVRQDTRWCLQCLATTQASISTSQALWAIRQEFAKARTADRKKRPQSPPARHPGRPDG